MSGFSQSIFKVAVFSKFSVVWILVTSLLWCFCTAFSQHYKSQCLIFRFSVGELSVVATFFFDHSAIVAIAGHANCPALLLFIQN